MKNVLNTQLIESFIQENRLTKTQFCAQCNISLHKLRRIMKNEGGFYVNDVYKIAKVLNVSLAEMFH